MNTTIWKNWTVVTALLVAATACGFLFDHHVTLLSQAMFYVLAVVIASYTQGWLASVGCAVGAVTALNFFFVPPRWTFEVASQEHLIALFTMLLVALAISHLAAGLRRETALAHLNEDRARQLQGLAEKLATTQSQDEVAALGISAFDKAFSGPCHLSLLGPEGKLCTAKETVPSIFDGQNACMRDAAVLGPGTGRWPGLNAWYLPLGDSDHLFGAVHVQPALASDHASREHAQALCTLLAQALLRLQLSSIMLAAQSEVQRQQVQSTFLAAISHDLRTPLAAVVGAASALQTQGEKLGIAEQKRLVDSIVREASYLSTLTENTLQLVRLGNATQDIQLDWESIEEIVGSVLARVRQHDLTRRIKSRVPSGLPLIQVDPVLIAQLLANLLDNALKYSSGTIDLVVEMGSNDLKISVKDRGPGIPEDQQTAIFEPYSRNDHSGQRGAGLGLALCRAIATAHKGTLTWRSRNAGGSSFTLTLQLAMQQPSVE
jgi:two-component system sensor histidine kinase KdpD